MSIERGDTAHTFLMGGHNWGGRKYMLGGGDTAHKLLMGGEIGVETQHNIEITLFSALLSLQEGFPTDAVVGGWVGGSSCIS